MFTKNNMMTPVLTISKKFIPIWNNIIGDLDDGEELPMYILMSELSRYLIQLLRGRSYFRIRGSIQSG